MKSLLKKLYRIFQSRIVKSCVLPLCFSQERLLEAAQTQKEFLALASAQCPRIWFHASSVGELESLWPIIQLFSEKKWELIVTIFSESARGSLEKLKSEISLLVAGYAPFEGEWYRTLKHTRPSFFVTAKYEAWPDLWFSLAELDIPLAIVSTSARKSLRFAKKCCQALEGKIPRLICFVALESDVPGLRELFPKTLFPMVEIEIVGEPRWDRVYNRMQRGNPRAEELVKQSQGYGRPWGVLGSLWFSDLQFLKPLFSAHAIGTLWIVPHKVSPEDLKPIVSFLQSQGIKFVYSQRLNSVAPHKSGVCILVNQMGILSELYSSADWAWIGGGWGAGVHSTIEPAIHGIPIACGPKGAEKFSEGIRTHSRIGSVRYTSGLIKKKTGQLRLVIVLVLLRKLLSLLKSG
jgi:3-deoxy-D-manno-octulosonic-acid transferase